MKKLSKILTLQVRGYEKIVLRMKLICFMMFLVFASTAADTYSQGTRFHMNLENVALKDVFEHIEENSEFILLYNEKWVDVDRRVSVDVNDETVEEILGQALKGTRNIYRIYDRQIVILNDEEKESSSIIDDSGETGTVVQQQARVSGIVNDANGDPLPGVTVLVKGTTQGTVTDSNGRYSLSVPSNNEILQFSFVGMRTQEVALGGRSELSVTLAEESIGIDEVVAIGYGTVRKSDLTGSVSSVTSRDIGDRVTTDLATLIQGKAAGVEVSRNNIRIRGVTTFNNTDPLVVIDGFLGGSMKDVNPNDIESIEILKDASSTAIYGSRGANGVILVTTKSGKPGPLEVRINAVAGISNTPKKLDLLNASQYIDYVHDALTNAKINIPDRLKTDAVRQDVTDWQDEIFRTGKFQEYNLDFSGGTEKSNFFVSFFYRHNEEFYIDKNSDVGRIRIKNQFNPRKWIRAGENISLTYSIDRGVGPQRGTLPFYSALPYLPVRDENVLGGFANVDRTGDLSDSPNPVADVYLTHPQTNAFNYQANAWAELEPVKGLTYRFQAGVTGDFSRYTRWDDEYLRPNGQIVLNEFTEQSTYSIYPLIESYLTYKNTIGAHDFSAMIGNTWQNYARFGGIGIYGQDYDKTSIKNVFMAGNNRVLNHNEGQYAYLSYFGRLNYQLLNKYLLTVNLRRDASPRFAPENRWGTFPSVAVAWKLNEESFIRDLEFFDLLKLRASWGISGNDAIGNFRYLSKVWNTGVFYPFGEPSEPVLGATVLNDSSQGIKWESTTSKAIAVDVAILNNSLSFTAEYFIKNTNDILFSVPRPLSLGYGLRSAGDAIVNAASAENKGFELQVGYRNRIGDLNYTINANYTNVENVVTSLGLGQPYIAGVSRTAVGYPIGYIYGHVADGVFMNQAELDAANQSAREEALAENPQLTQAQLANIYYQFATTSPGDVRFEDVDGDGRVTNDDRTMIGNPIPKHFYGFSFNLDYKGFDMNASFQGVGGNDVHYGYHYINRGMATTLNKETWVLDRWRSEAQPGNGIVPRAIIGDPTGNNRTSSLQVYPGDYLKLKQLSIGYSLPGNLTSGIGISSLRVYASGYNLFTVTKYPYLDPEFGILRNLEGGADFRLSGQINVFPVPRMLSLGVQIGL
jgi:TonB-dependent starch-binding outer membrane protein SusC